MTGFKIILIISFFAVVKNCTFKKDLRIAEFP